MLPDSNLLFMKKLFKNLAFTAFFKTNPTYIGVRALIITAYINLHRAKLRCSINMDWKNFHDGRDSALQRIIQVIKDNIC